MDMLEKTSESHTATANNHTLPTVNTSAKMLPIHPFLTTSPMDAHATELGSAQIPTVLQHGLEGGSKADSYCIRWKGFHVNMATSLEAIEGDCDFADVTLACEMGFSRHAHKLILASCSPYFQTVLKDTQGQHPLVILNEIQGDILDALLTYMYRGEVYLPESRLDNFFAAAKNLEVKGLEDAQQVFGRVKALPSAKEVGQSVDAAIPSHHLSDLSLLAAAATGLVAKPTNGTNGSPDVVGSINKRRKTMPRRLELNTSSSFKIPKVELLGNSLMPSMIGGLDGFPTPPNDENNPMNNDNMAINLSTKSLLPHSEASSKFVARAELLNIPNPNNSFRIKTDPDTLGGPKISLPTSPLALDMSSQGGLNMDNSGQTLPRPGSPSSASLTQESVGSPISSEGGSLPPQLIDPKDVGQDSLRPMPVTAATTSEQMAALLGPSWKSRQPRMCQYCQRMFSNKFNLKQHILNMHTVGRELHCEICQKKVKNKWYLRRHHVTHHGAPLKK